MNRLLTVLLLWLGLALPAAAQGYLNPPIYATGTIFAPTGVSGNTTTLIKNAVSPNNLNVFNVAPIGVWDITMPFPAFDGQLISIGCPGGNVTTLNTHATNGDAIGSGGPTSCATTAHALFTYQYSALTSTWVLITNPINTNGTSSQYISAATFGAVCSGASDDTAAIQLALNVAGPLGLSVYVPPGTCGISQTLNLEYPGESLMGAGAGSSNDIAPAIEAQTIFSWIGANGGTILLEKGTTTTQLSGNWITGIYWAGNGTAAIGIDSYSEAQGGFSIVGSHFTTTILQADMDTNVTDGGGWARNQIPLLEGFQNASTDGSFFKCVATVTNDCSQNIFQIIGGDYYSSVLQLLGDDANIFMNVSAYNGSSGNPCGIILGAGTTQGQAARNEFFYSVDFTNTTCSIYAEGTVDATYPSADNNILYIGPDNTPSSVSIRTGATIYFGMSRAPTGKRDETGSSSGYSWTDTFGMITQGGKTALITGGTTGTVTYPIAYGTYAFPQVTPTAACGQYYATNTVTTLSIFTTNTCQFWWQAVGQ